MKRKGYLYEEICKHENIKNAFNKVAKNIKNKKKSGEARLKKTRIIQDIRDRLISKKGYEFSPVFKFTIYEPKKREITDMCIEDKIVNFLIAKHILCPVILPCLIDTNVASRKGLGTKEGIKYHVNSHKKYSRKYENYYILKCDIHKFFVSIDKDILTQKLKRKIKDEKAMNIIMKVLDLQEKGLPIGMMTSQILAIFYLNDFDHYIKEKLKVKRYVRYQDDFILFAYSKSKLQKFFKEKKLFLKKEKLTLNKSSRIFKNYNNYMFLGRNLKGRYIKGKNTFKKLKIKQKDYLKTKEGLFTYISLKTYYLNLIKDVN